MKHLDTKSFIIGILATALFLACSDTIKKAAIPEAHAHHDEDSEKPKVWDDKHEWAIKTIPLGFTAERGNGYEPIAFVHNLYKAGDKHFIYRKRIK